MGAYSGLKGGREAALRINAAGGRKRGNNTKAAQRNRLAESKRSVGLNRLKGFRGQF